MRANAQTQTRTPSVRRTLTVGSTLALLAVCAVATWSTGCASTQTRGSSVRVENVAVTPSKTTRTTTAVDGSSQTERVATARDVPDAPPAPIVFIPDAQPQPVRDRGALSAWALQNPTASRELSAWMTKYPQAATQLVQWAHDNPTQVETFVTWSLGHRYEEVGAFFLGRTDYGQLERMRADDPEAVDALLQWSRRSDGSAEALVKHPRGIVWVATNVYDQKPPAESAAEARDRAKTQSK